MGDDKKGDMNYVIPPDALLSLLPKLLSTSREKGLLLLDKLMHSLQESDLSIEHLDGLGYTMAPASSSSSFMRSSSTPMTETLETDEDEDMAMAGGDDMRGGT